MLRDIGMPQKAWMRQARMAKARNMLAADSTDEEVAEKLNFGSTSSFRREFLTIYGLRPVDYVIGLGGAGKALIEEVMAY